MAEGIRVIRTPPGVDLPGGRLRVATYEVLFLYRLLPAIVDDEGAKVAPTKLSGLVSIVGQDWIDRYLDPVEVGAFDTGDGAWEFVSGERRVARAPDGSWDVETIPELIARLQADWATAKAAALARWTEEYAYTGRLISP